MTEADNLVDALQEAARCAFARLIADVPGNYYAFALVTTGEAHRPVASALSKEGLRSIAGDDPELEYELEWSHADSPHYGFGEEFFATVAKLWERLPPLDWESDAGSMELHVRLAAMEEALRRLDAEGLFGKGLPRALVIVNVEVMPPDYTNSERAIRLNPPSQLLAHWLETVGEE